MKIMKIVLKYEITNGESFFIKLMFSKKIIGRAAAGVRYEGTATFRKSK